MKKQFKIRASQSGKIMTNSRDKTTMGETAKTYCEEWMKEQIYQRKKITENKYFDKGNLMENEAIEMISIFYPELPLLIKNEEYFENEFITGTPDLILENEIIDIKCPWDFMTFPLFEKMLPEKNYYWQMQCYMELVGVSKARVIYVLTDTPTELVDREIKYNPDKEDEIIAYHNYRNIAPAYKIKAFDVLRNEQDIAAIKQRVLDCREFINNL